MIRRHDLGRRRAAVFDALLHDRADDLHPDDRHEAEAFWDWLGEQPRPVPLPLPRRHRPWGWAAAAALVLMAGASALVPPTDGVAVARYQAGRAERRVIRLDDGSVVTLGADSTVEVRLTPRLRQLALRRGEALFEVAHDRARPFVVATPHGSVTAVGTAFDIALGAAAARVTVVEGTIRIALPARSASARGGIARLAGKGQRVAFGTGPRMGFIGRPDPVDPDAATAWTRGQLQFGGEPLAEVIAVVNRYAADPADRLVLTDPRAGRIPVYGIVDQGDPAAIRDLLANPDAVAGGR